MWLCLVSWVLWLIDEFDCLDEQVLYDGVCVLLWYEYILLEMILVVDVYVFGDKIIYVCFVVQWIKDVIVDCMCDEGLEWFLVNIDLFDVCVNFLLCKGCVLLLIDFGGGLLYCCGWCGVVYEVLFKENLVVVLLLCV